MRDEKSERERRSLRERERSGELKVEREEKRSSGISGESGKRERIKFVFEFFFEVSKLWECDMLAFFLFVDKIFWIEVYDI